MIKFHKKNDGKCPYCDGSSFTDIANRRPNQHIYLCTICNKYCVKTPSGAAYPLENPNDPNSIPYN